MGNFPNVCLCTLKETNQSFFQAMDDHKLNEERPKPDTSRQAEIAFRLYDKDKDGYITKSEMEKLSKTLTKVNFQFFTSVFHFLNKLCIFRNKLTRSFRVLMPTVTVGSATPNSGK